ncbi:MAG: peptidoglycan editing factor PgeF [Patescibacteria group bacterium]
MFHRSNHGLYVSDLLTVIRGLKHGFTTRTHGDMRNKNMITSLLGIDSVYIQAQQVHGATVEIISPKIKTSTIRNVDGLVTRSNKYQQFLTVRTADCVPLLAVDPSRKIIGVAHSGWKGTVAKIPQQLIKAMVAQGADIDTIRVVLGPSIGACCYRVNDDCKNTFIAAFGSFGKGIIGKNGQAFFDLGANIVDQLRLMGIKKRHIETATICNSCLYPDFFSYRKDTTETFGEMLGFIGFNSSV